MIFFLFHQLLLNDILDILHSHTLQLSVFDGRNNVVNFFFGNPVLFLHLIIRFLYCMDDFVSVVLSFPSVSFYHFHILYLAISVNFSKPPFSSFQQQSTL